MANEFMGRLRGTMLSVLGIGGPTGVNIKNSAGILQVRNAADSAHASISAASLRAKDSGTANEVILQAPSLSGNVTLTLPDSDGNNGQFLSTDGSGVLSWIDSVSNADLTAKEDFTEATSSPLTIVASPPANCTIREVIVEVSSAASAGTPTIKVGTSTDDDLYMETGENSLRHAYIYKVSPAVEEDGSPEAIIATIVPDGQTFSGTIYVTYSNPA